MLKVNEEHRSWRRVLREENSTVPIMAMSLSAGAGSYTLQVECMEENVLRANPQEIISAMLAFLTDMNANLAELQLPLLPIAADKDARPDGAFGS